MNFNRGESPEAWEAAARVAQPQQIHPFDTAARFVVEQDDEGRKFKVGDLIRRTAHSRPWAPLGYETKVLNGYLYKHQSDTNKTHIQDEQWELVSDSTCTGMFMQTYTGRVVFPMDLRPEDVCIVDIAHALSMLCRYNGHSVRFYSVAEHCVLMAQHLRQYGDDVALCGLMHDATEAYLADVPRPVKPYLTGYKEAEAKAWEAIASRYGLKATLPDLVHMADNRILHDERTQNMNRCERDWNLPGVRLGVQLRFLSPERAKSEFLALFNELYGGV